MSIAWLRPHPVPAAPIEDRLDDPLDDTAGLIAELRGSHDIEVIDARGAHDLVWRHARQPFDLIIHELDDSAAHAFIPPYAVHFPGVLLLRGFAVDHPRAIAASRLVVVGDEAVAASLQEKYPGTPIVAAPAGVGRNGVGSHFSRTPKNDSRPHLFGLLGGRRDAADRAAARARQAGAHLEVITGPAATVLRDADVIVALDWPPPSGPPVAALAAMAAAKPVIVLETLATAGWPALDPQTWQPRGFGPAHPRTPAPSAPLVVSLDLRDEEHSLMLAMKRLAADAPLAASLGAAGHAWWSAHATIAHAAAAWQRILIEPGPPPRPFAGADGSEHAREVLAAFGVQVDFL